MKCLDGISIKHYLCSLGRIKNDDKLIQLEGVESLSEEELRQACRERGLLGLLSVDEMRQQVYFCLFVIFLSVSSYYV